IARDGLTALGVPHHHVVEALDADTAAGAADAVDEALEGSRRTRRRLAILLGEQLAQDGRRAEVAATERREDLLEVVHAEALGRLLHLLLGRLRLPRLAQLALEQLLPELDRGRGLFALDPVADLLARAGSLDEREPVTRRPLLRVRRDLHRVAVLQLARQRRDAAVDLRAGAVRAHLGVHREREVDGRRTLRQLLDVALRREDEDLVLEQVDAQELEELLGLARLLLPLQDLAEPR